MARWDRRGVAAAAKGRDAAVAAQVARRGRARSPRTGAPACAELGRTAAAVDSVAALATLPAAGERDLCPDGDPAGAARLVLQADETGLRPARRRARRCAGRCCAGSSCPGSYRALVENDTRPTTFVAAGLGVGFPLASTRGDLDLVARAGARAFDVLGLRAADVLVSALPPRAERAERRRWPWRRWRCRVPHLAAGPDPAEVARAVALLAPDACWRSRPSDAADLLGALAARGTVLPGPDAPCCWSVPPRRRSGRSAGALLAELGAGARPWCSPCTPLPVRGCCGRSAARAPARPWAAASTPIPTSTWCRPSTPRPASRTADPASGGELVLTQLGFRGLGAAALAHRRRAADRGRRRRLPALPPHRAPGPGGAAPARALVPSLRLRGPPPSGSTCGRVAGALEGQADVHDWRLRAASAAPGPGSDQLVVHVRSADDDAPARSPSPSPGTCSPPPAWSPPRWSSTRRAGCPPSRRRPQPPHRRPARRLSGRGRHRRCRGLPSTGMLSHRRRSLRPAPHRPCPAYLDHAASTPMLPEAVAAMADAAPRGGQPVLAARGRPTGPPGGRGVARAARRRARRAALGGRVHRRRHRERQPRGEGAVLVAPGRRPAPRAGCWPAPSSTTRSSTPCTWLVEHEGAEVTWLPGGRGRPGATRTTLRGRARGGRRRRRPGHRDVGQQRGRHGPAGRRARRGRARPRRAAPHRRRAGRRPGAGGLGRAAAWTP